MKSRLFSTRLVAISILASLMLLALHGFSSTMVRAGDDNHPIGNGYINASGGLPVGTSQHAIWFGDIDNDSFPDIATAGYSGVRAWIGDGDGNWTLASTGLPTNSYDGGVCMGDINNDGNIDIAAANYDFGIGSVAVWTGDGTGSWTSASTGLPAGGWYTGIHLADMNNDDNLDMAFGNENFGIRVYMGTGTGVWSDASMNLPTTGAYYSVWMDDVNHDNYTDLVAAGSGMHVWLGNGAGVWTEASDGLPWTDMWSGVTLGDINLDGHLDIAASMDQSGHGLRVWLGDGTSNWTAASNGLPITGLYYGVIIEDMIGNKYPDLLVAGYAGTTAVEIWEGDGGNSWTKYPGFLPTGEVIGVAAGDIDKNGYMDIAAAGEGFGVQVWKNDATTIPLKVDVSIPNGGESWIAGSQHQVNWTTSGGTPPLTIRIEYSYNGSLGEYAIQSDGETDDGTYSWSIPNTPSTDCFVRVNVTDSALVKNWDKSNLSFTILPAEAIPPTITNLLPLNETITGNTIPTISASYSDASGIDVGSVVLEVDSMDVTASATVTATDVTYSPAIPLSDAVHDIYLEVKDSSINQNKAKASWWFRVDTQPPVISNEQPMNQSTIGDSTPLIGASYADVSGSDIGSVMLKVDGVDVTPSSTVTPSDVVYVPAIPLNDGMHNVSLELMDNSTPANKAVKSWWFIVDTAIVDVTPPNITNLQPADQSVIESNLTTIGTSYDDASGIDTGSVYLSVDSIDVTSLATITPFDVTYVPPTPLTEGSHDVYLSIEDDSPNRNEAEASWSFEVNSLPPDITNLLPVNESLINDNTPSIGASYVDGSRIDTNSVVLRVDSIDVTSLATITTTTISYMPTALSEGHHDVYLEVGDQSGQQKISTVTWWFTVDTIQPTITNITPPDGSLLSDNDTVIGADYYDESGIDGFSTMWEFKVQASGAPVSGVVNLLSGGLRFTPDSPLSDDRFCAHLEVSDSAGNRATADWCFTIDTTAPVISNPQPADQSTVNTATPVISATYADDTGVNVSRVLLTVDTIDVTGSATITETSVTFTLASGLSDGLHIVYLYVEDTVPGTPNGASLRWNFTILTDQTDTDSDGLPDAWETDHFGDLTKGPGDDTDSDGLTNIQELNLGTDPSDPDTDGDGDLDGDDPNPLVPSEADSAGVDPLLLAIIIIVVVLVLLLLWFFVFKRRRESAEEDQESEETSDEEEESQESTEEE